MSTVSEDVSNSDCDCTSQSSNSSVSSQDAIDKLNAPKKELKYIEQSIIDLINGYVKTNYTEYMELPTEIIYLILIFYFSGEYHMVFEYDNWLQQASSDEVENYLISPNTGFVSSDSSVADDKGYKDDLGSFISDHSNSFVERNDNLLNDLIERAKKYHQKKQKDIKDKINKQFVDNLMLKGYSIKISEFALAVCDNDINKATNYLLNNIDNIEYIMCEKEKQTVQSLLNKYPLPMQSQLIEHNYIPNEYLNEDVLYKINHFDDNDIFYDCNHQGQLQADQQEYDDDD